MIRRFLNLFRRTTWRRHEWENERPPIPVIDSPHGLSMTISFTREGDLYRCAGCGERGTSRILPTFGCTGHARKESK